MLQTPDQKLCDLWDEEFTLIRRLLEAAIVISDEATSRGWPPGTPFDSNMYRASTSLEPLLETICSKVEDLQHWVGTYVGEPIQVPEEKAKEKRVP